MLLRANTAGGGDAYGSLRGVRAVDVVLLLLAGAAYAGCWPGPGAGHGWWMGLAVAQPLLGVVLLAITRLAGRSGLMGGALVLSLLMVVDESWTGPGWLGILASVLLLAADLGTTDHPRRPLALLLAAGYPALVAWFAWVAVLLLG